MNIYIERTLVLFNFYRTNMPSFLCFMAKNDVKDFDWFKYLTEYVSIYRSILNMIYWPIYDNRILTDICKFFKNHFLTDICRNFAFFDRYMKIFIFPKFVFFDFCSMFRSIKTSYIGQYKNPYIGLYNNVYKTLGDLAYIDLYTPYRFAA